MADPIGPGASPPNETGLTSPGTRKRLVATISRLPKDQTATSNDLHGA